MAGTKVQGRVRDFASIEFTLAGRVFTSISSIDYNDSVSRNRIRGKSPVGVGFDRGEYEAEGSAMFSTDEEFREFLTAAADLAAEFGGGVYDAEFTGVVTYSIPGGVIAKDELQTCKIKSLPGGGATGSQIEREVGLDIGQIIRDGRNPFGDL